MDNIFYYPLYEGHHTWKFSHTDCMKQFNLFNSFKRQILLQFYKEKETLNCRLSIAQGYTASCKRNKIYVGLIPNTLWFLPREADQFISVKFN